MPVRLIGVDLDGTIYNRRKEVTERTARALRLAKECGTEVVFVTGRPFSGVSGELLRRTGVRYCITSNGALTSRVENAGTRESRAVIVRRALIPRETAAEVAVRTAGLGLWCAVFHGGYGYLLREHYEALLAKRRGMANYEYLRTSRYPVDDLVGHTLEAAEEIENIWIPTAEAGERDAMLRELSDLLEPGPAGRGQLLGAAGGKESLQPAGTGSAGGLLHPVICEGTDIELGAEGADKGQAFLGLAASLGIDAGETMAVGDDRNDLGLLRAAGFSVAMGNAPDEVKRACDEVTADCDEDGAALAIERQLQGTESGGRGVN